jgi:hypothetical protein
MRIVVTGGSGKAGRWLVEDLRARDHDVLNVDIKHDGSAHGLCVLADLSDLGQVYELVAGADAVVHLAAIPAPDLRPEGETFRNNMIPPTTSSPPPPPVYGVWCGHRVKRFSACPLTRNLFLPQSTRPSRPDPSRRTHSPSSLGGQLTWALVRGQGRRRSVDLRFFRPSLAVS